MTSNNGQDSAPGICLLTPANLSRDLLAGAVSAALAHPASEVLILCQATQAASAGGLVRDLRALTARHGKVFLVEDNATLALELEAEGATVKDLHGLITTRKAIGREAMVGVHCGLSRHDAMEAGEGGADFIALSAENGDKATETNLAEHITWWSQLFEIPSVAFGATDLATAQTFLNAGADFLALGDPLWANNDMEQMLQELAPDLAP